MADRKDIWVVGKDSEYGSITDRVAGLLFDKGYNVRNFTTGNDTLSALDSGIRKHPALIVMVDSGRENYINEMRPPVEKAKELNIPTVIISPTSAVTLSSTLNTPAIKNDTELLGAVEKELKKQELSVNSAGSMDRW